MKTIKVYDHTFSHNPYSVLHTVSEFYTWNVNPDPATVEDGETVFFTESAMYRAIELKDRNITRMGWIIESPGMNQASQDAFLNQLDIFDTVFTFRKDFLDHPSKKFKFSPCWGSWIHYEERSVYPKSKNLSIIASGKDWIEGHKLRHEVIAKYRDKMDVYGNGYNGILKKLEGLKNYRYSIVIENIKQDYYFSEKLLDCFTTGTIPIYWGCPSVGQYFDLAGIIQFDKIEDLDAIFELIGKEDYESRLESVRTNFIESNRYKCPEDYFINYNI